MSVLWGALLAVGVFVVGQAILKFVVEPIEEQRKLIGEVAYALRFYANVSLIRMLSPKDVARKQEYYARKQEVDEMKKALLELSSRVLASLWAIPFYDTLALLGSVPKKYDVLEASDHLVEWSQTLYGMKGKERSRHREIVANRLGISKKIGEIG